MSEHSVITICVLAAYVVAAIFIWAGYRLRSKIRRLLPGAMVTNGTVVSVESAVVFDSGDCVFHPVFMFQDVQGIEHRVRSSAGKSPAACKTGDIVQVFYNPKSPHEAIIDPKDYVQMYRICFFASSLIVTSS